MSDIPLMTADEFRESGLLAEMNRRFLHPLGLAMAADVGGDTFTILDDRQDLEGWIFGDGVMDLIRERAAAVEALEAERRPHREAALGFWIQPLED